MSNQIVDKALAYIGENIQKPIIIRSTQISIVRQYSQSATVTAPTVNGYTFLCWVAFATSGWIGSVYCATPTNASATVWNSTYGLSDTATGNVNCFALYIRSDLA